MIGYGAAFLVGYFFGVFLITCTKGKGLTPWSPAAIAWGFAFMGLNWIGGL